MGRNGFFNMIYFGFYHTTKTWLPSSQDPKLEFGRKVILGLTAGTLARVDNFSFSLLFRISSATKMEYATTKLKSFVSLEIFVSITS